MEKSRLNELLAELNDQKLVICGAGHVSMPIIMIGKMTGFMVTVIEDREEYADKARLAGADIVICDDFRTALSEIEGDENTYFVIVTREHLSDRLCLDLISRKKHAYIGMMGSRKRVTLLKEALIKEEGAPEDVISKVHTPIGLDINAETPEEIAVSVMAEIIGIKNSQGKGGGLPRSMLKEILHKERSPMVLATITRKEGSAPRKPGTRMLVRSDGSIMGTIGGGFIESKVITAGKEMLSENTVEEKDLTFDLSGNSDEDDLFCGGVLEIKLEIV